MTVNDIDVVLHCKDCPGVIKSGLIKLDGVEDVKIDPDIKRIYIDFNPEKITLKKIHNELESLYEYIPNWCWMWRLLKQEE